MGLPQHVDAVRLLRSPDLAKGRLYAVITPNPKRGSFDAEVVDTTGNVYVHLLGYRTVALPGAVDSGRLKALQSAMSLEPVMA